MTMPVEQMKAMAYLKERGTDAPLAQIRERVADAFATMDTLLDSVSAAPAGMPPGEGGWCPVEVVGPGAGGATASGLRRRWWTTSWRRTRGPSRRCAR